MFVLSDVSCLLFAALPVRLTARLGFTVLLRLAMFKLCLMVSFVGSSCLFVKAKIALESSCSNEKGLDLLSRPSEPDIERLRRSYLRSMQKVILWLCWQLARLKTPQKQ